MNVGTMTGRGREVVELMKMRRVNILCVQETRWKGNKAKELGEGYKLYYSGATADEAICDRSKKRGRSADGFKTYIWGLSH